METHNTGPRETEYRKKLLARSGKVGELSPATVSGYQSLIKAGHKTGRLDAKNARTHHVLAMNSRAFPSFDSYRWKAP
jgi:hypothetical protein